MHMSNAMIISPLAQWAIGGIGIVCGGMIISAFTKWLNSSDTKVNVTPVEVKSVTRDEYDVLKEDIKEDIKEFKTRIGEEMSIFRKRLDLNNKGIDRVEKMLVYIITKDGGNLNDVWTLTLISREKKYNWYFDIPDFPSRSPGSINKNLFNKFDYLIIGPISGTRSKRWHRRLSAIGEQIVKDWKSNKPNYLSIKFRKLLTFIELNEPVEYLLYEVVN